MVASVESHCASSSPSPGSNKLTADENWTERQLATAQSHCVPSCVSAAVKTTNVARVEDRNPNSRTLSKWSNEWCSADVVNGSLIADPTAQVPGFNLTRRLWCTLNRFKTAQGRCAASLTRWKQSTDPACCCSAPQQTMIVEDCPVTRFPGGLLALHLAEDSGIVWLDAQSKR